MEITFKAMGDKAIQVAFKQVISPIVNGEVTAFSKLVKDAKIEGIIETIPAFCTLLVNYDPRIITYDALLKKLEALAKLETSTEKRAALVHEIPVYYGGRFGLDLEFVATNAGLTKDEVIEIHSEKTYLIYMLGFLPGFAYLGGLDERIHTPRLDNPRLMILEGCIGIGGEQTGIYPLDSPGGWRIIGRTPVKTYDLARRKPILFEAGDYIKFVPISESEYKEIVRAVQNGEYEHKSYELE